MQMLKRKSGITLVALIITIIILLILAGVSLSFVFNGGILDKAQQAVNEYENASQKEQDLLDQIDKYIENELGDIANDEPEIPSVDSNGLATENTTIVAKDDSSMQIVIPKGFAPAILQTGTTQSLPGENGAVKEIMPANEWNNITKEDINSGIVVVDNSITYTGSVPDFNEYVWIPIINSSKFKRIAWNGPYWIGSTQIGTQPLADDSTENAYWEDMSSEEYLNMQSSVSINKGFYISRYEASQKNSTTAQSKRGQEPWVDILQNTAITVSTNMNTSINSHLIYGIEWDSVLNWLLDSGAKIGGDTIGEPLQTITIDDIQSDSRSWGNHLDSIGGAETNAGGSAKSGGTNEYWKVNNIYDLSGNIWEWTQEKYSTGTEFVYRGGNCKNYGNYLPAVNRGVYGQGYTNTGTRVQGKLLCVKLY